MTPTTERDLRCPRCERPVMTRVDTDGRMIFLNAHPLDGGFDLYVIRADLRVMRVTGYSARGYDVHTCEGETIWHCKDRLAERAVEAAWDAMTAKEQS